MARMNNKHANMKFSYSVDCIYHVNNIFYSAGLGNIPILNLECAHQLLSANVLGWRAVGICELGITNQISTFPSPQWLVQGHSVDAIRAKEMS